MMPEIYTFTAPTMREALEQVIQTLGEDAVLVGSRTVCEDMGPGTPAMEYVEVRAQAPATTPVPGMRPTGPAVPATDLAQHREAVRTQVDVMPNWLDQLANTRRWLGMAEEAGTGPSVPGIAEEVVRRWPLSGGIRLTEKTRVVALVGPTGVGKTTTLAKLAAQFTWQHGARVGVIAADTFRLGALEQIRVFCQHLALPMVPVYRPAQMAEALQTLASCALVLIDTPGGSPRDPAYLEEMRTLVGAADPDEVHLVMSADCNPAIAREHLRRFTALQPDQLILTKLDDVPSLLDLTALVAESGLAVSYLGTGVQVPDALVCATPEFLAQAVRGH